MLRFLCSALLLLTAFPLLAQLPEQRPLPRGNQGVLLRMRQQLTQELQQIQRMIGAINPNDTQFLTLLKAQQEELTKQMKDITQQLEGYVFPDAAAPADTPSNVPTPPAASPSVTSPEEQESPAVPLSAQPERRLPQVPPYSAIPPASMADAGMGMPVMPPAWSGDPAWDSSPWASKPSKDLLEVKQTVESLRTEIAELKETIKTLETQIQLLNRNILLSERVKE